MMQVDEIMAFLRTVTYKKGWRLKIDAYGSWIHAQWVWAAEDSTGRKWEGKREVYGMAAHLRGNMSKEEIMNHLLRAADDCEQHETREFLKAEGVAIFYPHNEWHDSLWAAADAKKRQWAHKPEAEPIAGPSVELEDITGFDLMKAQKLLVEYQRGEMLKQLREGMRNYDPQAQVRR